MSIINIKVVSTISAFEKEILMQLEFLKNFNLQKQLSISKQKKTIFCGTGDSYAAACLGTVFSNFRVKSLDPLELATAKGHLEGCYLYLISISGRTISNIKLAKQFYHTTAVTANPSSKLAHACRDLIHLKFDNSGIQTAGSLSFMASALACISLVKSFQIRDYEKLYAIAECYAKKRLHGKVFILGNLYSFPIAIFCAAKLYEVLGSVAQYERIEQFSHMGLFSARRGDTILIFEKKNGYNEKLTKQLRRYGLSVIRMDPPTSNPIKQIIFFIFVSELLALHNAKIRNKRDCYFVEAKKLRDASSSMIY